ncbi:MAG TPA: hypothetical protein ENK11_07880 [Phycisphaerales bacterium]|nr:hypothetical protein [Phycisphaerales bacterium]
MIALCQYHTQPVRRTGWRPIDRILETIHAGNETRRDAVARGAAAVLLRSWSRLTPACRSIAMTADRVSWCDLALGCIGNETAEDIAAFVESIDAPEALPVAARLLNVDDRDAADRAEAFLLTQTARALRIPRPDRPRRLLRFDTPGPAPTIDTLARTLAETLDHIETHEHTGPALAALLLLDRPAPPDDKDPIAPIRAIVADEKHPAFPVLRRMLKRDDAPAVRRIAWRLLRDHPLAMAALERIARSGDASQHDALLEHAYLILNPSRAGLTTHLATSPPPNPKARRPITDSVLPQTTRGLSERARRGLPRLVRTLPAHPALTAAVHFETLTDPDVHTRLMHATFTPGPELADFCFDPSPAVAAHATIRWSSVGTGPARAASISDHRARIARKLARHPHEAVRSLARDEPTGDLLDTSPAGRVRLISMLSNDRPALSARLREHAESGEAERRVLAIRTARRLGVLDGWLDTLRALVDSTTPGIDPRVAATAAAALGGMKDTGAAAALEPAFDHPDPRVRANAVESLGRLRRGRDTARFVEIKTSPEHRARANALRALARDEGGRADLDAAGEDLASMLEDDRPAHRLSGVWLAERLLCVAPTRHERWQNLARRVASLAREEMDAHTKARAVRCSRRLLARISTPDQPLRDTAAERTRDRLAHYAAAYSEAIR